MPAGDGHRRSGKSEAAFRTISEVAKELDIPAHVLRFWESKFVQVKPLKRGGGRRYYRPEDIELLRGIRELLYTDGYTIKGVQKLLRQGGAREFISVSIDQIATGSAEKATPEHGTVQEVTGCAMSLNDKKRAEMISIISELEDLRDMLKESRPLK
ncbi:MAG: hypothetical protein CFH41_02440 [Alphaproteobacteria bacterium MarineAlpha11_Bin1]|nr:MAG: hypothetical protein CFH41_02440 [Alphaproteobacteria bacterium MarineAlpha11_Bin1]|tara:strand:- start:27794 stop:28261 length:468 start_codon:yes stop_codon:yes gene_type:complete